MTLIEYRQAVLKLTEEFAGPLLLVYGMPWVIRAPLSNVPGAGMELCIGFIEDLSVRGHPLTGANLYRPPRRSIRLCRECARSANFKHRQKNNVVR